MNVYLKIYEKLCSGEFPIKSKYLETHHIIPKHMGGDNSPDNLIDLDINQHKIAHWLLWKIYKKKQDKLVWLLRSGKYEEGILLRKQLQQEYFDNYNAKVSLENIEDFNSKKNNLPSTIVPPKIPKKVDNIRKWNINVDNIKHRKNCKNVYMFTMEGEFIMKFESLYSAKEAISFKSIGTLHMAASGKRNKAGGYRWSFTKNPNPLITKERTYKKTGPQKNKSGHVNKTYTQIEQYDLDGNILHVWNNRDEISNNLKNISVGMINHVVNGRYKNGLNEYKGFIWKKGKQISTTVYNNK
jgi:hypothetical protein